MTLTAEQIALLKTNEIYGTLKWGNRALMIFAGNAFVVLDKLYIFEVRTYKTIQRADKRFTKIESGAEEKI